MKNLFKNLMLVAVAAMAFTACEKDNADTNKGEEKTVITFDIDIEGTGTRTYFGAYDEETGYPTLLSGNETAKFNHWTTGNGNLENQEATINNGRFTVGFSYVNSGETIDAYLPASAWGDAKTTWYDNNSYSDVTRDYAFPMEQNPTTTSVDPKAHIFKATTTYNGEDNIDLYFEHQVAYGKMSLRNFAGADVEQYVLTINGETYVVNAAWTTDVWFACEPAEVSEMSVSVVTANGTYTKSLAVSAENTLNFVKGQVSKFGVNMDGVTSEKTEVIEFDGTIKSWKKMSDYGKYLLTGDNFSFVLGQYNNYENYLFKRSNNDCILGTSTSSSKYFTITDMTDASISASTLTPTAGTLVINEGGGNTNADKIHDVTITLTINGVEYVYTYYGIINGEAVDNGGNEGGETPEVVKLDTPVVTATVDGKIVTVNWNAVDGAANYTVSVDGAVKESTYTSTTYTFEGTYSTTHTISVVANPANTTTHSVSDAGTATAKIGADPNAGGGDDGGGEGVAEWEFSVSYQGMMFNRYTYFIFTGTDGTKITTTLVYPSKSQIPGTYEVSSILEVDYTNYKISEIIIGNTYATSASGTIDIAMNSDGTYTFTLDLVINGTNYKGSAIFG